MKIPLKIRLPVISALLLLLCCASAQAEQGYGSVSFANSGSAAAQRISSAVWRSCIDQDCTSAALALTASVLAAGKIQLITQHAEQTDVLIRVDGADVCHSHLAA